MKKSMIKASLAGFILLMLLTYSCKDPVYDIKKKGIDTEIKVGGDSLAIPIGKTDTLKLSDFLNADDLEFLKTMENGGYGFTMSDSIPPMEDLLKNLDKSKLSFADQVFNQSTSLNFGDLDIGDFKIPGIVMKDTMSMNIPKVEIGDISPTVNIQKDFEINVKDYAPDETKLTIANIDKESREDSVIAHIVDPNNIYQGGNIIPLPFKTDVPRSFGNLSTALNQSIDVPEGIVNIYQIDLEAGATLEISLELTDAALSLEDQSEIIPNLTIDPTNLFYFGLQDIANHPIQFDNTNKLTKFNSYKATKSIPIQALKNLPAAVNGKINLNNTVTVSGTFTADGAVRVNKIQDAKAIDFVIKIQIKGMKIKNMDFDIPTVNTVLDGNSSFSINNSSIPEQVKTINKVYFGKTAGSPLNKNLVITIKPENLPVMDPSSIYKIENLKLTFPNNFKFASLAGSVYDAGTVTLDKTNGYTIELNLTEVDLSQVPITNKTLAWNGQISYSGKMTMSGRMQSMNISKTINPAIKLNSQSAIKLTSADVTTNDIVEKISSSVIPINFNVDISDQVASLGVVNIKPGAKMRLDITKPTLPLTMKSSGIKIKFTDLFEFQPHANLSNNEYTITGDIPDFIELELKALRINKNLQNGKLIIKDSVSLGGDIKLLSGNVNSSQIESLNNKEIIYQATINDMSIESTSIQLKTLEASYSDKTTLNMAFDIPAEIYSLDSLLLKSGASLKMDVNIQNLPNLGANPLNAEIKLKFPSMLMFSPGQVNANNELTIKRAFVNGKLSETINLKGLKFNGSPLAGKLNLNEEVGFDVKVSIVDPVVNSSDLSGVDIKAGVTATIKGLSIQHAYGKFNYNFGDLIKDQVVSLSDIPEMLRGDDVVLDIANPVISISTESNIGIPVDAELGLTQVKNGTDLTDNKISFNFSLPKTSSSSVFTKSAYWISPSSSGMPAGYQYINKNVSNLFKPVPDAIKINIKPTINMSQQHFIDLMANYKLKVKYDIKIPFAFGKDLNITLKDTMEVDNLDLSGLDVSTGGLELLAKITNSIPLDLKLSLKLMKANGDIIATTTDATILAGAPNGNGVVSDLKINIADNLENLKELKKIEMVFKASSNATVAGTPIKPSNFLKAELKARVLGGIKVKL